MHKYLSEYNMSVTPDTPTEKTNENSNLSYQDIKNQLKSHKMLILDNEQTLKFQKQTNQQLEAQIQSLSNENSSLKEEIQNG